MENKLSFNDLPAMVLGMDHKISNVLKSVDSLIQKLDPTIPTENPDDLLSVNQAAKLLDLNTKTIYRKCEENDIPHYRTKSNRIVFVRAELKNWIRSGMKYIPTKNEISIVVDEKLKTIK